MSWDRLGIGEEFSVDVYRARPWGYALKPDETLAVEDLIVNAGRTFLAARIASQVGSPMAYTAIGTVSTAATLTDTAIAGEIKRKLSAVTSTLSGGTVFTNVATFGGAADTIQSIAIREAGVLNHASSGQGTMFQRVTFAAVTLANSDILALTMRTIVGSIAVP